MLDVQLFGLNAGAHHAVNILLHSANAVLVFVLFDALTQRRILSWGIALIFALHPMHVESVAWVAERKDVLSTFFILLAMCFYAGNNEKGIKNKAGIRFPLVFCSLCFGFSLLSKPMYVTFPLLLLVFDFWPLKRMTGWGSFLKLLVEKWLLIIFSMGVSISTLIAQRSAGAVFAAEELPWGYRLATAWMAVSNYIQKFFFSERLSIFYPPFAMQDFNAWGSSTVLVLTGVTMIILLGFRKKNEWVIAGWFLFLVSLLPVVGLIKAGSQSMADRYTYFAYMGLSILLLWTGEAWAQKRPFLKVPLISALILWLGLCVFKTADRIQDWQNTEKLFQSAVEIHSNNYVAYKVLADDAYARGDLAKASEYLAQALKVLPAEAESIRGEYELNLAVVYQQLQNWEKALELYQKVSERMPLRADLVVAMGDIYARLNQPSLARLQYEKALPLLPTDRELQDKLASVKKSLGAKPEAV